MTQQVSIGLDVGSTYVKALAVGSDRVARAELRRATPWSSGPGGTAEIDAAILTGIARSLVDELLAAIGRVEVTGIGVSGMAEAGALLKEDNVVTRPIVAWFDPRGHDEMMRTPAAFRAEFPGRTGLPVSALATVAKLLHLRAEGVALEGCRWLNVPELVAHALGGDVFAEQSLAGRTGLVDQDTGETWPDALDILEVPTSFVPAIRSAGDPWGTHRSTGATITVAGHDHLVASIAAGVLEPHQLYDSMGTAEALVRPLATLLPPADRAALAAEGVNVVRHALPGKGVMLGGTKAGLILRRVLQMIGVQDTAGRADLDRLVMKLPPTAPPGLVVSGAANDDGVLTIRTESDGLAPEILFAAALAHTTDELHRIVETIERVTTPATQSVLSGGWAGMESVRRSRAEALPDVHFSARTEDTAFGAAMFGAYVASDASIGVESFARQFTAPVPTSQGQEAHG